MAWSDNSIMFWQDTDLSYKKVTDHGRSALSTSVERIENKQRMADGTLRRYSVVKKRTWTTSWDMLPSSNAIPNSFTTADHNAGSPAMAGEDIESFHNRVTGAFRMIIRRGSAQNKTAPTKTDAQLPYEDADFIIVKVMITDYSKDVVKRGIVDFWNLDITLEEV